MSNNVGPEFEALQHLREVVDKLTGELAGWRRRALKAEQDQAELGVDHDAVASRERILELETVTSEQSQRLGIARARVEELMARLRFLEEQVVVDEERG